MAHTTHMGNLIKNVDKLRLSIVVLQLTTEGHGDLERNYTKYCIMVYMYNYGVICHCGYFSNHTSHE